MRWIYRVFVEGREARARDRRRLNAARHQYRPRAALDRGTVHQVLINEKYIGNNVYNRFPSSSRRSGSVTAPRCGSVRTVRSSRSLTEPLFEAAQAIIRERSIDSRTRRCWTLCSACLQERGYLSGLIIDETEGCPSSSAYQVASAACYVPMSWSASRPIATTATSRSIAPSAACTRRSWPTRSRASRTLEVGRSGPDTDLLTINDEFTASIVVVRCRRPPPARCAGISASTLGCGPTSLSRFAWTSRIRRPSTITSCRGST